MPRSKIFADGEILTPADVNQHLVHHVPSPGDAFDTGWQPITLLAGYTASESLGVRRIGQVVYIRGAIQSEGGAAFPGVLTLVGNVPVGFRPGNYFRTAGTTHPSTTARGAEWAVATGGDVQIGSIGAGADICRLNASWPVN